MPHLQSFLSYRISNYSIASVFILLILFELGCGCQSVDCIGTEANIDINFIQNDDDVLSGSDPLLGVEDIHISTPAQESIPFSFSDDQFSIWLIGNTSYTIILGAIDTINLQGSMVIDNSNSCCDIYRFNSFSSTNSIVCKSACSTIDVHIE